MERLVDEILDKKNKPDGVFYWLYPFTNENINGYFSYINFQNKSVLSVTSSGDHLFNAIIYGAKRIDAFDINPLAPYYIQLKTAAIKSLQRDELLDFLFSDSKRSTPKSFFNIDTYEKVKELLPKDARNFWDYVFYKYSPDMINKSRLFAIDISDIPGLIESNIYLQDCYYNYLKRIISSKIINFHCLDLRQISSINKKFDIIILSNILARVDEVYGKGEYKLETIREDLDKIRSDRSIAILNYYYSNTYFPKDKPEIYDDNKVKEVFPDSRKIYFPSSEKYLFPSFIRGFMNYEDNVLVDEKKLVKKP